MNSTAAGASDDWVKGGAGVKYSYTVELPDTGKWGFRLPASKIRESGKQGLNILVAMLRDLAKNNRG